MRVMQVSAFLENRPGRLLFLMETLADNDINLVAHNIVDASDFGIVHLIVDDPVKALSTIRGEGITASTTTVLTVAIPDEPGALVRQVLKPLAEAKINIEYSYAYSSGIAGNGPGSANVVLKVDDLDAAEGVLADLL